MFGRATITLSIGPHSSILYDLADVAVAEMYFWFWPDPLFVLHKTAVWERTEGLWVTMRVLGSACLCVGDGM